MFQPVACAPVLNAPWTMWRLQLPMFKREGICGYGKGFVSSMFFVEFVKFPDQNWFSLTFSKLLTFADFLQNSLTLPWPWKNFLFPDFPLTVATLKLQLHNPISIIADSKMCVWRISRDGSIKSNQTVRIHILEVSKIVQWKFFIHKSPNFADLDTAT